MIKHQTESFDVSQTNKSWKDIHPCDQAPGLGGIGLGGLLPSYTVVSSPVTRDTVVTETLTEEFKLNFRNQEIYTTITSTSLVTTQITSFITKTQRVLPTANPLAGLLG